MAGKRRKPYPGTKAERYYYKQKELAKYGPNCYIATAVYGSYNCSPVWILRRYRDYTLATTWHGRLFIRFYYTVSPLLVKWFGNTKVFKSLFKRLLDNLVYSLQGKGISDAPYNDRRW